MTERKDAEERKDHFRGKKTRMVGDKFPRILSLAPPICYLKYSVMLFSLADNTTESDDFHNEVSGTGCK